MVQQNISKYYWWGFGATLAVLALLGIAYLIMNSNDDLPSSFDESELPQLPGESGDVVGNDAPSLPVEKGRNTVQSSNLGNGASSDARDSFSGTWRVYSERLFYDEGGGGTTLSASTGTAVTQKLSLNVDGTWSYGESKGTWKTSSINDEDWKAWGIESYGPIRKIILEGWNKGTASGPVEVNMERVDFIWVLYRTGPPTVSKHGTVHLKFGR
ncbi:hypothetical protein FJZ18_00600 [Candidatus Pacearchaeota archaeon]|nr:hypothetical protein [Candidatus Pacearchaeota archaeon]